MNMMIHEAKKIKIESAALSDPGTRRNQNQDMVFHQIGRVNGDKTVGLFLVCDGMGGQRGGEIASRIAVDTIAAELAGLFTEAHLFLNGDDTHPSFFMLDQKMWAAVEEANAQIYQYAQNHADETPRLGTTVTAVLIYDNLAYIAHAGDGRVYIGRQEHLIQLTQDHSLVATLAQNGYIDESEIASHPQSHIILRALGIRESIELDTLDWELEPGDKVLICSDGLWKAFPDSSELGQLLQANATAASLCHQLVSEAKERDGSDNISAVVVRVSEADQF
jgi:protein phosphatase